MISDAVISVLGGFVKLVVAGLVSLMPAPPAWSVEGFTLLGTIWGYLDTLSTWIPVTLAVTIAGAVLTGVLIGIGLGVTKTILSYLTFGGGAK